MDLRRKSDEAIVEALKAEELPALDAMDEPNSVNSYEYLLRMRMDRVKASAVEDARNHVEAVKVVLETLRGTKAADLWIRDLEAFEMGWASLRDAREAARTGVPLRKEPKKVIKLKKATE